MSTFDFFIPSIQDITDLTEISNLLAHTIKRQQTIDEELVKIIDEGFGGEGLRGMIERLDTLSTTIPPKLQPLTKKSQDLAKTIDDTTFLAETISKKVRDLDTVRARVKATLSKVGDIIDLSDCIEAVNQALKQEQFEVAATHLQRYLHLDIDQVLEPSSALMLTNTKSQLKGILKDRLEKALTNDNSEDILRFCKLYVPLDQKEEGLTNYCHYLRRICSDEAELNFRSLLKSMGKTAVGTSDPSLTTCVASITQLFENVAKIIEEQFPKIEQSFGEGSQEILLKNMQAQCDIHCSKIFDLFLEQYSVMKRVQDVSLVSRIPSSDREAREKEFLRLDPRELGPILDEMVAISKSAEFYDRFIKRKAKQAQCLLPSSDLKRKMQDILGNYILLEEYFMMESVQKAMKTDEAPTDNQTSPFVDYVFFILQKSSSRAVESASANAICAIVNHTNTCLNRDYKEVLQHLFREAAGKNQIAKGDRKYDHLVLLNNMEISVDFIKKIKRDLENSCNRLFSSGSTDEHLAMINTCLADLADTSNNFKKMVSDNMDQFSASITPRIRSLLDIFATISYDLTEIDYQNNEINDPWVTQFIGDVTTFLSPFSSHLTSSNHDLLVHLILSTLTRRMEQLLFQKRVSQLGAMQLDKDLRSIGQYFGSITQRPVRDKLARLGQIARLLSLEKVEEVTEFWGETETTGIAWRLSVSDLKKVLALRVDFMPEQIAKLKL